MTDRIMRLPLLPLLLTISLSNSALAMLLLGAMTADSVTPLNIRH